MSFRRLIWLAAVVPLCLLFPQSALAGPTDPVTVSLPPVGQGDAFVPGVRLVEDLAQEYVEEEFFISGESTLFNYANDPPDGPTDITPIEEDVPYTTRLIVRRPAKANKFNGTVVIEWWNSTAGFDVAPVWDTSAEYFAESGIIYVGVTNSTTSLGHLVGGCSTFGGPPSCGTRYSTLSMPENGLAYEMLSQISTLLKDGDPANPIPENYEVARILHAGESQQAGSIVTYASGFHLDGVNDGYFVQAGFGARPINFGPACGGEGSPPFPECTPRLAGSDRLVRTDLPVPVYQMISQTDFEVFINVFGRQPDTPTFRYYEIAGGAHASVHENVVLIPGPPPILLEDLCANQLNTTADGPIFVSYVLNALWERMQEQIMTGAVPPAGVLMDQVGGVLERDSAGNVTGGVRLPAMEAPTATYESTNQAADGLPPFLTFFGNLACRLSGSVFPFDGATLDGLYPDHDAYTSQVAAAVKTLKSQGLLLQSDASIIKKRAARSAFGQ
jgi:hypothetical protein